MLSASRLPAKPRIDYLQIVNRFEQVFNLTGAAKMRFLAVEAKKT